MKKYIIPEMTISKFVTESILTQSGDTQKTSAMEQAKAAVANIEESQKTFSIIF